MGVVSLWNHSSQIAGFWLRLIFYLSICPLLLALRSVKKEGMSKAKTKSENEIRVPEEG